MKNNFQSNGTWGMFLEHSKGQSLGLSGKWKLFASTLLLLFTLGIGQMWADDETITWNGTSLTGVSSTNITAGTATAVDGDTYHAGTISISSSKIQTLSKKHTNDTYWEDFSAAAQQVEGGVSATGTARIELPFTVAEGYTYTISDVGYKMEQGGGGGPAVHAFIVQGSTATWLNYTTANTIALTGKSIALSAGSAKLVFVLGVTSNFTNGRQFKFLNISIKGAVAASGSATKHSVTYALNGGTGTTPTQADVAEGAKFTLHDGTTNITAPSGKQFAGWNDGTTTYAGGAEYTMGTSDVTLTAQWETAKTDPTATFSAGAYVVGAAALDLSGLWSSNSDGAVTYALKEASDDAEVSGTSFTATKAGSYVVTASQAATSTYNAIEKEATITVTWPATGAADVLFNIATGTGNTALATASKEAHSASINTLTDFAAAGGLVVSGRGAGKDGLSTKLQTLSEKDADKYIYVSFKVADGYIFTINSVTTKVVAVSTAKTIEVALSDATTNEALSYNQGKNSSAADHEFEFAGKAYEGTITLKIYAYGATDDYRLAAPLTVSGTVAVKPSPVAPSISAPTADSEAEYDLNDEIAALSITASGYPTPTYQWYSNSSASTDGATAIEGAQSASYTPANDVASNLYYYCVATNSQGSATSHYFHVTVNAPAVPTIYTETTALTLTSNKIATGSETFTFSGANLGETAVTLVLASAVDGMTLSESSVTPTAGAITDKEITVSYKSLLDVAEATVDLYLKQGDDILKTIVLTYSSTAGIESLTSISAATTWNWDHANSSTEAIESLDANNIVVFANYSGWVESFKANSLAGRLQYVYRGSNYAQGHSLKFNTTIPGRVTVTFSNTGSKDIARAPRITDVNGTYAPTAEEDGSKNTTAMTYAHNVAAGEVLIEGFEMKDPIVLNMLRYYKVEFEPTYTVAYAAGEHGSGDMADANAYVAGDEVTLLANTFTPDQGYIFGSWAVTKTASGDPVTVENGKFTMPAEAVTVTAQWEDVSKVAQIVETSAKYDNLAAAIAAAEAGQTVQLIQNISQVEGIMISKDLTLDLNGKTLTVSNPSSTYNNRAIKVTAGTVIIKDGTVDALSTEDHNGGCYGGLRQEGGHLTCNNVTFKNYRKFGLGLKPVGGTLILNECTVISEIGGGMEMGAATAVVNNCTFTQTGTDTSNKWISTCFGLGDGANLTINGGTYTSDNYSFYIYTSGGTINVNSGTFAGDVKTEMNNTQYPSAVGTINISGGTFDGVGENPIVFTAVTANDHISISGGVFDAPIEKQFCAEGYVPQDNGDGTYGVTPKDGASIFKAVLTSATAANYNGYYADDENSEIKLTDDGANGYKFAGTSNYIKMALTGGTFETGDVLHMTYQTNPQQGELAIYDNTTYIAGTSYTNNTLEFPAGADGLSTLYIRRTSTNNFNGWVSAVEVTRVVMPTLTAIKIDGRDGVINEANKTVAVTIPYEADLAALTVVPTIVRNAAHATTPEAVVSNEGAWIIGANTYRVMDKDGDYTDYTITLTRDVLKHTVSFNTHGGSAIDPVEVEDGDYLAAAPADPEKEDYIFQYWSETEDGAEVDVTTVQIDEDKTFHAVWASDGAIKLLNGSTVNHTNFITAVTADETVEFKGNVVNYAKFSGTVSGVNGVKDLTRVIAYNATTNKTKIQISAHNNSTSGRNILVKGLVEGAAEAVDLATIALGNKEDKVSDWIEFNNAANRTIYIMVSSSAGDVYFTQVKVIESGETTLKMAGEAGYSLNFNQGRFFGVKDVTAHFEGLNVEVKSSDCQPLNTSVVKLASSSMSFDVAAPVTLTVTTNNSNTYYVTKGVAGTDNETAKTGASDFDLTAGTWYITGGASNVEIKSVAFAAPKCAEPSFAALANSDVCEGDGYVALNGTATVADAGVPTYQWYNADGDEAIDGATAAEFTPTADGSYYVIATNHLADHSDNAKQSATVTVTTFASAQITTAPADVLKHSGLDVTLSVAATGKNISYEWFACDDAEGNNPVAFAPAQTGTSLLLENIEAGVKYYKVLVSSDCGTASAVAKVEGFDDLPQVDVTASTVWDMTNVSANAINLKDDYNPSKQNVRLLLANIEGVNNNASFNSQALMFEGQHIGRTSNNVKHLAGQYVQFNVTVPGMVSVTFASNGSSQRTIQINGKVCSRTTNDGTYITYNVAVEPGSVEIEDVQGYVRISKIEFKAEADYQRTVNPSYLGTLCWTNNAVLGGATLYEFAGKNENNYLVFDEVAENRLEAGKPYIFMPENGNTQIKVFNTDNDDPLTTDQDPVNNMYGTITGKTLVPGQDNNMYYFSASHIWAVKDFTVEYINIPAYYCYVDYEAVLADEPAPAAPAPGRRRVTMGVQGEQVATGMEQITNDQLPIKVLINGQLFILRGEKMFNANGQLVK